MMNEPSQQLLVYDAPKSLLAVKRHDWDTGVVPLHEIGVRVDVNQLRRQPIFDKRGVGILAQMTTRSCV